MRRQSAQWEKILANELTGKGLLSKTCKWVMQLNIKKQSNQKWTEDLNFSKDIQMICGI